MSDLIVADDEYIAFAQGYQELGEEFEEAYQEYVGTLASLCQWAISDGAVAQNLLAFIETAHLFKGQFSALGDAVSTACIGFVGKIEDADEDLY
jgi:DNA-binding ferritin-like protein (Dps family)